MLPAVHDSRRFLLLGAVVLLQACDRSSNATKGLGSGTPQDDQRWSVDITNATLVDANIYQENGVSYANSVHGVDYEVHGGLPGLVKIEGETITITSASNRLEVKNHHLTANGKDGGDIKPGDKVVLDAEGRLWVNNAER